MRIARLLPCMLLAACGDNQDVPIDAPKPDAAQRDAPDVDAPPDAPPGGPVNLTNLTVQTGVVLRADFTTPLFFSPDNTKVAVVANYSETMATPTGFQPFVVNLDGSGTRRLVDNNCANCDLELLVWTADSASVFATGDLLVNNEVDAWKLDPAMTDQTPVVAFDAPTGGDAVNVLAVSAGGGATRVWVVGDMLTDNRREAGGFAGDATLPFNTATPPPIVAAGELFDGTGSTISVFDARGDKIAFVSDATVAGRFDLNVANADGTGLLMLVQGGVAGVEITAVGLSPDGTKVAFTMDSAAINNGFDLHMVPTAGGATVKLSPDRPVASPDPTQQDVFFTFEWSADSKFVAFSADLTDNSFDQGYIVDTTLATPVAVEVLARADIATQAGAQGIRGKLLFDPANNVYFRARVSTANNSQFTFFKATSTGTKTEIALPMRTDATVPDIGAFGITPDGTKLVFSSDTPVATAFNLFAQPI